MKNKNVWICILFILVGLVLGGLLGELTSKINSLWWLSYGKEFGLSQPLVLDLNVLKLTFGLMFKINVASIIGIIISMFIYKKMVK